MDMRVETYESDDGLVCISVYPDVREVFGTRGRMIRRTQMIRSVEILGKKPTAETISKPHVAWAGLDDVEVEAMLRFLHTEDETARKELAKYLSARMQR